MENLQTIFFFVFPLVCFATLVAFKVPKVACHANWFVFPSFSQLYDVLRMGFSS